MTRLPRRSTFPLSAIMLIVICMGTLLPSPARAQLSPPNIIILLADDLGWGDVGYHGSRIATPHIDRLAKMGTRHNQFYVQPVCSPTRAALLTRRYPMRMGLQCGVVRPWAEYGGGRDSSFLLAPDGATVIAQPQPTAAPAGAVTTNND
ncbi:MAG: sulfatase-like hydrolase/transferase [Phycisphaeraceae bacterium]